MTDREIMQQALDALEKLTDGRIFTADLAGYYGAAKNTLRQALAQPEQEPAAKHVCNLWINPETSFYEVDRCTHPINEVIPVYTAPPRKPWVGLTDDEVAQIEKTVLTRKQAIKMIEHHLKEKNT